MKSAESNGSARRESRIPVVHIEDHWDAPALACNQRGAKRSELRLDGNEHIPIRLLDQFQKSAELERERV